MSNNLNGKLAVVTGGSRGIGWHCARALHDAGATVAITGRRAAALEKAAAALGERGHAFVCDQRDPALIATMAAAVLERLGTPDILVNNAGCMQGGAVETMTLERWNKVLETNLTGVFLTTQAFLAAMRAKGRGDIFMMNSMSGRRADPGGAAYAASKFGLTGFAMALMYEVRRDNIRVMTLHPSAVETGEDTGAKEGPGLHLHAADLAATLVHLACLPGRTLVREMEIWGTNP